MSESKFKKRALNIFNIVLVCALATMTNINSASAQDTKTEVKTGNKPSTFNYRINPYIRHNSLENDVEITDYSVFLMTPTTYFGNDGAFVYEGPMTRDQDLTEIGGLEDTGFPDPVIRMPMVLEPFQTGDSLNWIPVILPEFTLPLGNDSLSGDTLIASLGGGWVISDSPRWFIALIQFYDFDLSKSSGRDDVDRVRLRWFWQYMVSPKNLVYIMPEFQASFDFEEDENNYWFGPEIGKVIKPARGGDAGFVVYAKPGFGIDNEDDSFEREWSIEIGVRWMWDQFPLK